MRKTWLVLRPPLWRTLPFLSFRYDRRLPSVLLILSLISLMVGVLKVAQGEYPIPPLDVLKTLLGLPTENPDYPFIIHTLRLPRTLVAFGAGVGLAISGTLLQCLTRNPLADPAIIGVNAGAGVAAVLLILLVPTVSTFALSVSAFAGAALVTFAIYLLAWKQGSSPIRLILVGVGLTAALSAVTTVLITFGEVNGAGQALVWLAGSVYGRGWEHVTALFPWLSVLVPLSWMLSRPLNVLNLGDDLARGLGLSLEWQRGYVILLSAALAGVSVATAGTLGFIGLIAPHLGRQFVGPGHEGLIPVAALIGGLLVVLADWLGQALFAPLEFPCGVMLAIIGAPYFLYLLVRTR